MATRDKEIHIPMIEGMDTGDDERLVGGLELMQNARMSQKKTPRKRYGFTALTALDSAGNTISNGNALGVFNNQLVMSDSRSIYSYSQGISKWVKNSAYLGPVFGIYDGINYGKNISLIAQANVLSTNEPSHYNSSLAAYSNLKAVCWHDGAGYGQGRVCDINGKVLATTTFPSGVLRIKAISFGTKIGFIYKDGTTVYYKDFNQSTYAFSDTSLLTGAVSTGNFDCCVFGTSFAVAAYISATESVVVKTFDSSVVNLATHTETEGAGTMEDTAISICYDSTNSRFYIGYALLNVTTFYKFLSISTSLTGAVNTTAYSFGAAVQASVSIGIATDGASAWYFITLRTSGDADNGRIYGVKITVPSTIAVAATLISMASALITKPVVISGNVYFGIVSGPSLYASSSPSGDDNSTRVGAIMTDVGSFVCYPVARFNYGEQADDSTRNNLSLPLQEIISNGSYYEFLAAKRIDYTNSTNAYWETELKTVKLKYNDLSTSQPLNYNKNLIFGGALPMVYDGDECFEYGFMHRPVITARTLSGGAGAIADGTYSYIATYEYTDANGVLHVSEPSPVFSAVVTGGPKDITIDVRTLKIGHLSYRCIIHLYRSVVNSSDTFYRVTSNSGVINARTSTTISFTDTKTDTEIVDETLYYFNGTVITPEPPISSNSFWTQGGRLFNIPFDKENTIGYSQEASLAGNSRLESGFSDFLEISTDDTNSQIQDFLKCGIALDDKNICFKDNSIVAFNGTGPDRSGDNDSFTKPVLVSSDVGCSNPRSLASCRLGVIFKSKKGIYLLGRDLNIQFIGDPVGAYDSETITGAVDVPNDHYIIFTTAAGYALIFDYLNLKWSIYSNYTANAVTYWQDQLCHLKSTGVVRVEDSNYSDNGDFITQKYIFNWLKFADLMGFVRVKRATILGKWKSAHNLKLSYAYDYELYNDETDTFTPTNTSDYNRTSGPTDAQRQAGANSGVYQVEFHLARQKCEALKLTIEDVDTGTDGECFELTGVGFLVGFKRGKLKLPENKKT